MDYIRNFAGLSPSASSPGRGPARSRGTPKPRPGSELGVGLLAAFTFCCSMLGFLFSGNDAHKLAFSGLMGVHLCVYVIRDLRRRRITNSYCINYIIAGTIVGKLVLVFLGFGGVSGGGNGFRFSLMAKPWIMILYMNLQLMVLWLLARWLYRRKIQASMPDFAGQLLADGRCFEFFALLALPLVFGETLGYFVSGSLRYVFDVAGAALSFIPFFVGRLVHWRRPAFLVWVGALLLNGIVMIMGGGRFPALLPIVLFSVGVMFSFPLRTAWKLTSCALVLVFPGLYLVGLLGIVRDDFERDPVRNLSRSHLDAMASSAGRVLSPQMTSDVVVAGASRMVPWANYAPPILTPEFIPYRGFQTFGRETLNAMTIYAFSPQALAERAELSMGTLPANDYGYMVNEQTSVEWGVIADGWSRAGWWSTALFLLLACTPILLIERFIVRMTWFRPTVKVVFISFLMGRFLRMGAIPLLELLRGLVIYMIVYTLGLLLLNVLLNAVFPRQRQLPPRPRLAS